MTARIARLAAAAALGAALVRAQGGSDMLKDIDQVLSRGDRAPTIDEILGDTLSRIRGADAISARAAAARLREIDSEIRLYESLLKQVRAGLLVDVPRTGAEAAAPSAEAVAIEKRKVEELARQLEQAELGVKSATAARPKPAADAARPSAMADAMLDVLVDVPNAPAKKPGSGRARDPANLSQALFQAGDWAGTLEALDQIPAEQMTPEQRFRRARALDQLGRIGEAKAAYEAVVAAEKEGAFGRQAAWMLKLARTREQVAATVGKSDSRPTETKQ